ncbi:MAG: hypothetical protein FWC15_05665 [Fibromonadales bacterium]|nr:hypothetical protein [Fibromonadales bacterium]
MPCPFCAKSEPVRIEIKALDLRICPSCLATFMPASKFSTLREVLSSSTKAAWMRKLTMIGADPNVCPYTEADIACLEHNVPLVQGAIPGYSFEGKVPTCCDLQHLPPSLMKYVLQYSLGGASATLGAGFGRSKPMPANPLAKFLGKIAFFFFEKKKKVDDGFERLQYESKFQGVLGEWVD